jgi:hypothetical protein
LPGGASDGQRVPVGRNLDSKGALPPKHRP